MTHTKPDMTWMFAKDVVGGTIGGCLGIFVGQPLDTVKVRLQSTTLYSGVWNCLRRTVAEEGVTALYKGMAAPLVSNAPINAVAFGAYGVALRGIRMIDPALEKSADAAMIAGCFCGFVQSFIMTPSEMVKCKLQVQQNAVNPLYTGAWDCIRKTVQAKGVIRGLYTGWGISIIRDVPSFGAYFAAYEWCKIQFSKLRDESTPGTMTLLMAGAAAGVAGWVSTYPADVLKSVQQTLPDDTPKAQTRLLYLVRQILKQHGPLYFTRGLLSTIIRAIPVNAVTFYGYEKVISAMERSRHQWYERMESA